LIVDCPESKLENHKSKMPFGQTIAAPWPAVADYARLRTVTGFRAIRVGIGGG
jgi:hypothetical protein